MLYVVGLGLRDGDISEKGLQALEDSDVAYAEIYTNPVEYDFGSLEERTGTEIEVLERSRVEEEDRVMKEAEERDVAFLVSGDPLAATTHQDILFRARKRGIETEVVHAPSVFTAVAETGLSLYKFGRTTTLTVQNGEVPESVFDAVAHNREMGLHTLMLVDPEIDQVEALDALEDYLEQGVVLCSSLGRVDRQMEYGRLEEMDRKKFEPPVSVVVPGELSGNERERLESV